MHINQSKMMTNDDDDDDTHTHTLAPTVIPTMAKTRLTKLDVEMMRKAQTDYQIASSSEDDDDDEEKQQQQQHSTTRNNGGGDDDDDAADDDALLGGVKHVGLFRELTQNTRRLWAPNDWWRVENRRARYRVILCVLTIGFLLVFSIFSLYIPSDTSSDHDLPTLREEWANIISVFVNSSMASVQVAVRTLKVPEKYQTVPNYYPQVNILSTGATGAPSFYAKFDKFLNEHAVIFSDEGAPISPPPPPPPPSSSSSSTITATTPVNNSTKRPPAPPTFEKERITEHRILLLSLLLAQHRIVKGEYPADVSDAITLDTQAQAAATTRTRWTSVDWARVSAIGSGEKADDLLRDGWNHPFYYARGNGTFHIHSQGPSSDELDDISSDDVGVDGRMSVLWTQLFSHQRLGLESKVPSDVITKPPPYVVRSDLSPRKRHQIISEIRKRLAGRPTSEESGVDPGKAEQSIVDVIQFWIDVTNITLSHTTDSSSSSSYNVTAVEWRLREVSQLALILLLERAQESHVDYTNPFVALDQARNVQLIDDFEAMLKRASPPAKTQARRPVLIYTASSRIRDIERLLRDRMLYEFVPARPESIAEDERALKPEANAIPMRWFTKWKVDFASAKISADDVKQLSELVAEQVDRENQ